MGIVMTIEPAARTPSQRGLRYWRCKSSLCGVRFPAKEKGPCLRCASVNVEAAEEKTSAETSR